MISSPCKDCPDRLVSCHSNCEDYKEYQAENNRLVQERGERSNVESAFLDHLRLSQKRMKNVKHPTIKCRLK
jgi:hypothetical protein